MADTDSSPYNGGMDEKPKPRRRRFQISLRTLMLLVTIASVGFGWLGYKVRQADQQKGVVEAIRTLGGEVMYDYEFDADDRAIDSPTPPGPVWLRDLMGIDFFATVTCVDISPTFKDAELAHLRELPKLKLLQFNETQITDGGLVHLRGLTQLRVANLYWTQITDVGLAHLQGLPNLQRLYLDDTMVTTKGCQELKSALPKLQINPGVCRTRLRF